ncbi:hypothetical protein [Olivibacter sitiensis]|uniref:hypothetical protein n=1 Tax=Olivibacter sitiensis TaxID=376470 RepID=UPI000406A1B2|nr:hypothetical protein [Olivibacter sitiensis]
MQEKDVYAELTSIRNLMERSAKFISLHGLSGVLAGIYALAGAYIGYRIVYQAGTGMVYRDYYISDGGIILKLAMVALAVLMASIATGVLFSIRKARLNGQQIWNPASKGMLVHAGIPLVTGGLLILILLVRGHFGIIAPACLVFYGLALVSASYYTFQDVRRLGLCEIALGLGAALLPGYGLLFWAAGFGVLHILYGLIMYYKYDNRK